MTRRLALLLTLLLVITAACHPHRGQIGGPIGKVDPPEDVLALADRPLTPVEQHKLDAHGFAILGGGSVQGFHVGYAALFHAHAPVYVTADALLYAWHSSYDKILIEVEQRSLVPTLDAMLGELRARLAAAGAAPQAKADLDVYLAVALSFLHGKAEPPVAGGDPEQITALFQHGERAEGSGFELFGEPAQFDWSMLKPRGHYTTLAEMQCYFRAMSWLGRAEFRIAHRMDPKRPWQVNRRALGSTLLLASLFDASARAKWQSIDATLTAFVGPQDSLSLPTLSAIAAPGLARAPDDAVIAAFERPTHQAIHTQLAYAGEGSIAYLVLGQRFAFDSSVLGDLVHGSLATDPPRLMPTPLDVAHTVFHNPAATALLAPEVERYGAVYQRALAAHAAQPIPDDSLYHLWLGALRELSPDPARDANLPAPLTSDAWARRMLATQLASWAELRHDNLLYAKQSFTGELECEFPDAYVDPYPAFYARMEQIARRARAVVSVPAVTAYLDRMAATMARLRAIAERERANQPLTSDDLEFIDHMVSLDGRDVVCAVVTEPKGWYAELFFEQATALWHDPVIADVHTQPTDEAGNMVGRVLHVATGKPRMIAIRIAHDGGAHTQTYRGFVSSYGELVTEGFQRLTDDEWRDRITRQMLGTPPWLADLTAP
ncbi:MAG TPA: DUF3160 domain-containing protein [Kofleriaceae bacterium]|jgi:hypothetical protein|nr:DUF3160 domain-containing protein [Kofleriaceae bacterium]